MDPNAGSIVKTFHLPGVGFTASTGAQSYYNETALGSTIAVRDVNGNFSSRSEYDAYGITGTILQGTRSSFQFAGKHGYVTDEDTGMQLLGHRYYLPKIGRFLTQDPIGQAGGLNLYAYCDNNPLTKVDPDGMDPDDLSDAEIGSMRGLHPGMRRGTAQSDQANEMLQGLENQLKWSLADVLTMGLTRWVGAGAEAMGAGGRATMSIGRLLSKENMTIGEARLLIGAWAKDPVKGTAAASLRYHFNVHGSELGAKSVWQYLRKAQGFNQNLRGAGKALLENGKVRYMKDGKYIIKDVEGKIISFGRQR